MPEPRIAAPLRIFLSYGHDSNEVLVRLIKADLEKRGHDAWFDKSEIKFGDNWRRSIAAGILNSHRVRSFLSKHSIRDSGVCRDEIAIANGVNGGNIQSILVENGKEVQPTPNIGFQWLNLHSVRYLLASPLRSVIHGGRERYLIVIEAPDKAGHNPLVETLARNAQRLLKWLARYELPEERHPRPGGIPIYRTTAQAICRGLKAELSIEETTQYMSPMHFESFDFQAKSYATKQ